MRLTTNAQTFHRFRSLKVSTNNVPRQLDENNEFKYKGHTYNLGDFLVNNFYPESNMQEWDGVCSETYWSGVVVKIVDNETVIVGSYFSE